jgi:adenosylcobinamide-GDP ribazoletransferase
VLKNNSFFAAVRFLTIFPVPGQIGISEKALRGAVPSFPLVGVLLGTLSFFLCYCFWNIFDPMLAAVFMVAALLLFSGGLHLDGLADTADGFFSSRPREQILEIMRDSRIGVMGVVWLVVLLLAKVAALSGMPLETAVIAVFLMPIAGRIAILLLMAMLPYARPEGGLGSLFKDSFDTNQARIQSLVVLLVFSGISWVAAGPTGILAVFAVLLMTALFAFFCRRKIGGVTGDTLGAACELAEAVIALIFVLKIGGIW